MALHMGSLQMSTTKPFQLSGRVDGRLLVSLSTQAKFPLEPSDPDTPPPPHHLSCSAVVNHRIMSVGFPKPCLCCLSAALAILGLVQLQNPDDCVESSHKLSFLVFICTNQDAVQLLRAALLHLTCLLLLSLQKVDGSGPPAVKHSL